MSATKEKTDVTTVRQQAAMSILCRHRIDDRIAAVTREGITAMDAIKAVPSGCDKHFTGVRDSIDAKRIALKRDFWGGLISELEAMGSTGPVRKLLAEDDDFNKDVVREMRGEKTGDAAARSVADVFTRHLEKARVRLNAAGANIGRLGSYIPQGHDAYKLCAKPADGAGPRQKWIEAMVDWLDLDASLPDIHDPTEIRATLGRAYDNIADGRGQGPTALEKDEAAGLRSPASRLGECSFFYFKDADAFMEYAKEYGRGGVLDGVLSYLEGASRKLALMETLGLEPELMLKSVIAEQHRLLREGPAGKTADSAELKALDDSARAESLQGGKVAAWFAELAGEVYWPSNTTPARAMAVARASQALSKLGTASLSAVADVFVKAMNIRVHGVCWGEALARSMGQYFKAFAGEEKELARQLGPFVDDVAGEMRMRWDVNISLPGKLASVQDKCFKWSGLNWITESAKAGYGMWFSRYMGEVADKPFDALDAPRRAILEHHGFDAGRWEFVRLMAEKDMHGRRLIVPQKADEIHDAALRACLTEELAELKRQVTEKPEDYARAEAALFARTRRELRTEYLAMVSDETMYAIIEPDAKPRPAARQRRRPHTVVGRFWHTLMQYGSFPLACMQRQMGMPGRMRGGASADAASYDPKGAVGAAVSIFMFGCLAITLNDIAHGRKPKDLTKKETILAVLLQSGGAGILGDFFFNKIDRFSSSFAEMLAGSASCDVARAFEAVSAMLRGEYAEGTEDSLRDLLSNAPFVNLWYTRAAADWLALYHIRESFSPGTLARTERTMKEEYGRGHLFSAPSHGRRGGWTWQ